MNVNVKNSAKRGGRVCSSSVFYLWVLLLLLALVGLQLLFSWSLPLLPLPKLKLSLIHNDSSFCSSSSSLPSGDSGSGLIGEFGDMMVSMLPVDLPFTLFVPSPPAFDKFLKLNPVQSLTPQNLNNTYAIISRVLGFSAVPQHLSAGALPVRTEVSVDAVSGLKLVIWRDLDGMVVVNGIRSECINIRKGDVIVHIISGVLMDAEFEQSFLPDYEDR
ncbi:fasciclin-like arabinogalactan family protein [Carex rostrata]